MVTCSFFGRLGNNMFQYAMARIIANKYGMKMGTMWNHNNFLEANECYEGHTVVGEPVVVDDVVFRAKAVNPLEGFDFTGKKVHLNGYFQDAVFYNDHRDFIKGLWQLPPMKKNTQDLVVHLRLTDYWWIRNKTVIHPKWYFDIINREKFKKLYIVVEPHITNKKYLSYFQQWNPVIVSKSPKEDFNFLRSFDRIVCSNSTFAWWAAFLSDASKIYLFGKWMGLDRTSCLGLTDMTGAIKKDGEFIRDKYLENKDWTDYWKQPEEFFK